MSRIDVWNKTIKEVRQANPNDLNLMLMSTTRAQKIKRNGVYVTICGEKYWYMNPEETIMNLRHEVFVRYDPADGSVRSGKSLSMTIGFILWSCSEFNGQTFAICGKTAGSILRNVILPMQQWLEGVAKINLKLSRSCFDVTVNGNTNRYYFFGGKDESSYMLIQGMTLAGVMFDEVALMPKSFVEQALARCSVKGSRFWFNCNPDSPQHWFYQEWSLKLDEKNAAYLHFTMDDNYSLDPAVKKRYESLYTGVFKERYINGKWCVTEGIIYDCWKDEYIIDDFTAPEWCQWYISMDYGTVNPCSMGLWCVTDDMTVRVSEYYYDSRKEKLQNRGGALCGT